MSTRRFESFAEFYPYYLGEHSQRITRRMHLVGSTLSLLLLATAIVRASAWWFLAALVAGYGCAWIGHFFFEKNRPATFRQPLYSFIGDWRMWWEMLSGKLPI